MSAASHRKQWRPAVRQSGTSLIELMIAMVISLVILSGVVVVFINMKQSFTNQDQLALLEDNERLALSILTGTAQSAGYFPDPVNNTLASLLIADSTASYGPLVAGQAVNGTTGTGNRQRQRQADPALCHRLRRRHPELSGRHQRVRYDPGLRQHLFDQFRQ